MRIANLAAGALVLAAAVAGPTAALPLQACPANCLVNGGFELPPVLLGAAPCPPAGWAPYVYPGGFANPGGEACQARGDARTGDHALRLVDPGEGVYTGLLSAPVAVLPGQRVLAEQYVRSAEGATAAIFLEFLDADGGLVGGASQVGPAGPAWTRQAVEAVVPPGAVAASLLIYSCAGCGGVFLVDDADLRVLG